MKERPILFSAPMVRALLDGSKTQTRRIINARYLPIVEECLRVNGKWIFDTMDYELTTPYGRPGDRLWVRENHILECFNTESGKQAVTYRADYDEKILGKGWRPSIHMPRWASRIDLEITEIRVERLIAMSNNDAFSEGTPDIRTMENRFDLVDCYRELWEKINGAGSWEKNPWVWVVEFKRVRP